MSAFEDFVHDPSHRRQFEKLLRLAAKRGDDDLVAERLGWGIDPDCTTPRGRTPMMMNVRGHSPSVATIKALLKAGADPSITDHAGLTALDYARRKLLKIQSRPQREPAKSPSLDENDQLRLTPREQAMIDRLRKLSKNAEEARERVNIYWKERLRAARRVFDDPAQIEAIVQLLEARDR